ncbi:hypothetical protein D3C72_1304300 [compost metagenome]
MGIQRAVHAQHIACRQADAADLFAAGIDAAVDLQAATIKADIDVASLHFITDHQVTFAQLEGTATRNATARQPCVEPGKVLQLTSTQYQFSAVVGHLGTAGIVAPAGTAQQCSGQRHAAPLLAQCLHRQTTATVVACRYVDARSRIGADIALAG